MQMRRQRTVKPSFFRDPRVTAVPMGMRFFATALMAWADDHGRGEVLPRRMQREMLSDDDVVSPDRIEEVMLHLAESGFLLLWADEDGRSLFQIAPDLLGTVDRRNPSTYPEPPFANSFANRVANRGLGEREGARVEFGSERGGGERESVRLPPEPFCHRHPAGAEYDCRHCGTARSKNRQWELLRRAGRDNSHLEGPADAFDDDFSDVPAF